MDLTHWYYSMYEKPYEQVADMIRRLRHRCEDMCSKLQMPFGLKAGAWPHASLSTLWALTCELISARTLRPKVQKLIIAPWVALFADDNSPGEPAAVAVDGCNDRPVDTVLAALPAQLQTHVHAAMRKLGGQALPHVAFACARCSSLYIRHQTEYLLVAQDVGKKVLDILEKRFLGKDFQLWDSLPTGAQQQYAYRCGRRKTRADPRSQACRCGK